MWIWQLRFCCMGFSSVCTLCIHCIQMVETTKARGAQEFNSIEWNGKAALASHRSTYATAISLALVTLLAVLLLYHLDQSCVSRLVVGNIRNIWIYFNSSGFEHTEKKQHKKKMNEMRQNNLIPHCLCVCDAQRSEFYGFFNFYGQFAFETAHFFTLFLFFYFLFIIIASLRCVVFSCFFFRSFKIYFEFTVLPLVGSNRDVHRLFILYSNLISWRVYFVSFFVLF